jgi:TorA maturation chaperone TorD
MFNDLLGEQLQQCQLALLQQNLNSGNPLQTLIRKQMVSTNLPINQQLTALQNSYFALFLNNDPMVVSIFY